MDVHFPAAGWTCAFLPNLQNTHSSTSRLQHPPQSSGRRQNLTRSPPGVQFRLRSFPVYNGNGPGGSEANVNELYEQQQGATFTAQRKVIQCHLFNESALHSESKWFYLNMGDKGQLEAFGPLQTLWKKLDENV